VKKGLLEFAFGVYVVALLSFMMFSTEQIKDDFINLNRPSVVKLTNLIQTSGGTGFYVRTPSGAVKILTNNHVCRLAAEDKGLIASTETDVEVVYVESTYEFNDLCLLSAPANASPIKLASSVRNTENIYILGHPLLEPKTLTRGQMSGNMEIHVLQGYDTPNCEGSTYKKIPIEESGDFVGMLMGAKYACVRSTMANISTANILPGNSGSPVLNAFGHVVGVAFASAPGSGRSMLVPLEDVVDFLKDK
jgi:hypothetical protein